MISRNDAHLQVRIPKSLKDDLENVAEYQNTTTPDLIRAWLYSLVNMNNRENDCAEADKLVHELRQFTSDRHWEKFHSPKNLSMALSVETAELMEHFQWMTEAQSRSLDYETTGKIAEEIADVYLYLFQLADRIGIDAMSVAMDKLKMNAKKYPIEKARGSSKKYSEFS